MAEEGRQHNHSEECLGKSEAALAAEAVHEDAIGRPEGEVESDVR